MSEGSQHQNDREHNTNNNNNNNNYLIIASKLWIETCGIGESIEKTGQHYRNGMDMVHKWIDTNSKHKFIKEFITSQQDDRIIWKDSKISSWLTWHMGANKQRGNIVHSRVTVSSSLRTGRLYICIRIRSSLLNSCPRSMTRALIVNHNRITSVKAALTCLSLAPVLQFYKLMRQ